MASKMFNEWLGLWKLRNQDIHGQDKVAQTKARAEQVRREVELLYEQADQEPPANMDHIDKNNLEIQLEKTSAELIGWLSNWGPVVHQHQQQLRQQQQEERQQLLQQLQEQLLQSQQQHTRTQRQLTIPDSVSGV
jgi:ribosomal protein L17